MTSTRPGRSAHLRNAATDHHERTRNILHQPVYHWDLQWQYPESDGRQHLHVCKWVKTDRLVDIEPDREEQTTIPGDATINISDGGSAAGIDNSSSKDQQEATLGADPNIGEYDSQAPTDASDLVKNDAEGPAIAGLGESGETKV